MSKTTEIAKTHQIMVTKFESEIAFKKSQHTLQKLHITNSLNQEPQQLKQGKG
jgi:hypothetical protein